MGQRVRDTGAVTPRNETPGPERSRAIMDAEEEILEMVRDDPGRSTRSMARDVNVSTWTVRRALREEGMHPYHIQRVQCLSPADYQPRMNFCRWLMEQARDPDFLLRVLVTDEAMFTRQGVFNMHNTHTWAVEHPHTVRQDNFQHRFSLNIWVGIIGDQL